ncbi:MAG: hypothetical protein IJQ80_08380, partial [Clostridia bacterium]|nr:hypothetical protein [Clostridia bacterium]
PYFHELQSRQDVEVIMEGKRRIMLGSNNYLGLTVNDEVVKAGLEALEKLGTGSRTKGSKSTGCNFSRDAFYRKARQPF